MEIKYAIDQLRPDLMSTVELVASQTSEYCTGGYDIGDKIKASALDILLLATGLYVHSISSNVESVSHGRSL